MAGVIYGSDPGFDTGHVWRPLVVGAGGNYGHLSEVLALDGLLDEERDEWTEEVHVAPILRPVLGEWGEVDRDVGMLANEEAWADLMERRGRFPLVDRVSTTPPMAAASGAPETESDPRSDALALVSEFPNQQHIVWTGDDQSQAEGIAHSIASGHVEAFCAPYEGRWLVFAQRSADASPPAVEVAEEASDYWWPLAPELMVA